MGKRLGASDGRPTIDVRGRYGRVISSLAPCDGRIRFRHEDGRYSLRPCAEFVIVGSGKARRDYKQGNRLLFCKACNERPLW